jgi:hypothetical protein
MTLAEKAISVGIGQVSSNAVELPEVPKQPSGPVWLLHQM